MPHAGFHNKIEVGGEFPPAKGRYILYVSLSCPFAHRALISHALKGLQDAIRVVYVHPIQSPINEGQKSWVFGNSPDDVVRPPSVDITLKAAEAARVAGKGDFPQYLVDFLNDIDFRNSTCDGVNTVDTITNRKYVKDIYDESDSTYDGRWTVPILWDTVTNKIVNAESAEICEIFDHSFDEFALNPSWTMYPTSVGQDVIKSTVDSLNSYITLPYQCFFAPTQIEYCRVRDQLYDFFNKWELSLANQRFIAGSAFTEADIRLVVTLLRFDINQVLFKIVGKRIRDYVNISAYLRDVYQNVFNDEARAFWNEKQSQLGAFSFTNDPNKVIVPLTDATDYSLPVVDRSGVGQ